MIFKKIFFIFMLLSIARYGFADTAPLSNARPRTVVYVYNKSQLQLKSRFTCETLDGKPIANHAHYPNCGTALTINPYDSYVDRAIPEIAELARNTGIERNRTYIFTETIDLPGLGPVLQLKQHLVGNPRTLLNPLAFGSTIKAGFAAPLLGVEPQYYDDQAWHRLLIPADDGNWIVDFCFYSAGIWGDIKAKLQGTDKTILAQGITSIAATVGTVALATKLGGNLLANEQENQYLDWAINTHRLGGDLGPNELKEQYIKVVMENPGERGELASTIRMLERDRNLTNKIADTTAGVSLGLAAATWLSTKISSIRDNLLYKIAFVPHEK